MNGEDVYNAWKTAMDAYNKRKGHGRVPEWHDVNRAIQRMWQETAKLTRGVEIRWIIARSEDYEGLWFDEGDDEETPILSYNSKKEAEEAADAQKIPKRNREILAISVEV